MTLANSREESTHMKKIALSVAAVSLCLAGAAVAADPAATPAPAKMEAPAKGEAMKPTASKVKGEGMMAPLDTLQWMEPMGAGGPKVAIVHGDPKKGNSDVSFFMKFPAGFDSGWH